MLQEDGADVSPWHDIALYNEDGTLNFFCEIPMDTTAKFEVATVSPRPLWPDKRSLHLSARGSRSLERRNNTVCVSLQQTMPWPDVMGAHMWEPCRSTWGPAYFFFYYSRHESAFTKCPCMKRLARAISP